MKRSKIGRLYSLKDFHIEHVFITSTLYTGCTRTHIIQYNEEAIVNPKKITSLFSITTKHFIFWCPCRHCTIHYSVWFAHVRWYNNTTHYLNVLQWSGIFEKCAWIWINVIFRPSLDILTNAVVFFIARFFYLYVQLNVFGRIDKIPDWVKHE